MHNVSHEISQSFKVIGEESKIQDQVQASTRGQKLIVLFFLTSLVTSIILGIALAYTNYNSVDPRFKSAYPTIKKSTKSVFAKAKANCLELSDTSKRLAYISSLKNDMIATKGIENVMGLLSVHKPVDGTNTCWVVWLVDANGVGYAGYRDITGYVVMINSVIDKVEIEKIVNEIRFQGYDIN